MRSTVGVVNGANRLVKNRDGRPGAPMSDPDIRAVFWDFGGVILTSPFDAFARYEAAEGLPHGLLRRINATNPDSNAWARLERGEIDTGTFYDLFSEEARTLGHDVDARVVLSLIEGDIRPEMVAALRVVSDRYKTACLTNNFRSVNDNLERASEIAEIMAIFDAVIESSQAGMRKPDPRFYTYACETLDVAPEEVVFLDDLGVNLKPARAMGIRTIKVVDPGDALAELEACLGHPVQ